MEQLVLQIHLGNFTNNGTLNNGPIPAVCPGPNCITAPDVPTLSADAMACPGSPVTIKVLAGNLNDGTAWVLYSNSCGGTYVDSINSLTDSFVVNTPLVEGDSLCYYVRGEGSLICMPNGCDTVCVFAFDTTRPVVFCLDTVLQLDARNMGWLMPGNLLDTIQSYDNCGIVNAVSLSKSHFDVNCLGENLIILTADDGNGNTNTCISKVTVLPSIPAMGEWAFFLFGLITITVFAVGVYNVEKVVSV